MEMDDSQRAAVAQNELRLLGLPTGGAISSGSTPQQEKSKDDWKEQDDRDWERSRDASWNAPKWRKQSSKGTGRNAELDKMTQTQVLLQMMTGRSPAP